MGARQVNLILNPDLQVHLFSYFSFFFFPLPQIQKPHAWSPYILKSLVICIECTENPLTCKTHL